MIEDSVVGRSGTTEVTFDEGTCSNQKLTHGGFYCESGSFKCGEEVFIDFSLYRGKAKIISAKEDYGGGRGRYAFSIDLTEPCRCVEESCEGINNSKTEEEYIANKERLDYSLDH